MNRCRSGSPGRARGHVEQVERPAGRSGQVGGDGGYDAAGRTRDDEHGVLVRASDPAGRPGPLLAQTDGPALAGAIPISTAPGSRRVSSIRRPQSGRPDTPAAKSTAFTSASGRSRLYVFVNPVTAPPSGAVAPASS